MTNLNRCYGQGYLHYITTSCYKRRPLLSLTSRRDLFVEVLEHVRRRYHFVVVGYVVMPEHVHLLLSEPERGNPSTVMQAVKQGLARRILGKLRSQVSGGRDGDWGAGPPFARTTTTEDAPPLLLLQRLAAMQPVAKEF